MGEVIKSLIFSGEIEIQFDDEMYLKYNEETTYVKRKLYRDSDFEEYYVKEEYVLYLIKLIMK